MNSSLMALPSILSISPFPSWWFISGELFNLVVLATIVLAAASLLVSTNFPTWLMYV